LLNYPKKIFAVCFNYKAKLVFDFILKFERLFRSIFDSNYEQSFWREVWRFPPFRRRIIYQPLR